MKYVYLQSVDKIIFEILRDLIHLWLLKMKCTVRFSFYDVIVV